MWYYGFTLDSLIGMNNYTGYDRPSNHKAVYNPLLANLGNDNLKIDGSKTSESAVDWFGTDDGYYDLRYIFVK